MNKAYLITCEHAVKDVPEKFWPLFKGHQDVLDSHRGWDPGTWKLSSKLAMTLGGPLLLGSCTRLLIELSREENSPELFSEFTANLDPDQKEYLLEKYYHKFRFQATDMLDLAKDRDQTVLHLSIHSFTPVLNGGERKMDIGLLFDPERLEEKEFCERWKEELKKTDPTINVVFNEPYTGLSDGLTSWLRKSYSGSFYQGIELEMNHKNFYEDKKRWYELTEAVIETMTRLTN